MRHVSTNLVGSLGHFQAPFAATLCEAVADAEAEWDTKLQLTTRRIRNADHVSGRRTHNLPHTHTLSHTHTHTYTATHLHGAHKNQRKREKFEKVLNKAKYAARKCPFSSYPVNVRTCT